jgi:NAD(P)-dependent dehydrogenase (short-subunit alcohol dehydrogenase family)
MSASGRLEGKRTLITGGGGGLGLAIAERFSEEGARIAICDVNPVALAEAGARYPDWLCIPADVSSESSVAGLFDKLRIALGGLDVLVNNAGISGPTAPIEDIETSDWQAVLDINVLSAFFCTRLAVPMLKVQGGAIIIMSSVAGRLGYPFRTPYSTAKWALVGLTKSLASELGPDRIRVNAILPGMTNGARLDSVIHARAEKFGRSDEEQMALQLQSVSMRMNVDAVDIANSALFFASDEGRRVTGMALSVDAGLESIAWR